MKNCTKTNFNQLDSQNPSIELPTNLPLSKLEKSINSELNNQVYSYVLTTVNDENGKFLQMGCGPNIEGGRITLCTCKHYMRAYKDPKDWKNVWICGIVNSNDKTFLYYLMKVDYAADNMYDLCECLSQKIKNIKSASKNIFGDIYIPNKKLRETDDKHDISNYFKPMKNHKHEDIDKFQEDISYRSKNSKNRYASFLAGDPENSFIWTVPKIILTHPEKKKFTQGCKKWDLNDFFKQLK